MTLYLNEKYADIYLKKCIFNIRNCTSILLAPQSSELGLLVFD